MSSCQIFKRLYACGSSRVSFAIDCLGNMSDSFEPNLGEGMEELYFGADQVSIPESDDSAGRAQYYVESYVYEYGCGFLCVLVVVCFASMGNYAANSISIFLNSCC